MPSVLEAMQAALAARQPRERQKPETNAERAARFYSSLPWRRLRLEIIKRDGGRCAACGASPADGTTVLNVDHIEPLSRAWERRLDPTNLQTLCGACNHGKLDGPAHDFRPGPTLVVDNAA